MGAHFKCIDCGYDLKGADLSRACPECGWPIAMTLDERRRPWRGVGRRVCHGLACATALCWAIGLYGYAAVQPDSWLPGEWMREYYWYTMDGLAYVALAVLVASIGMVVIVPKARRHIGVWFAAVGAWGFVVLNLPAQWMSVGPLLLLAGLAAFICLATLSFYKVFIAGEMQW